MLAQSITAAHRPTIEPCAETKNQIDLTDFTGFYVIIVNTYICIICASLQAAVLIYSHEMCISGASDMIATTDGHLWFDLLFKVTEIKM